MSGFLYIIRIHGICIPIDPRAGSGSLSLIEPNPDPHISQCRIFVNLRAVFRSIPISNWNKTSWTLFLFFHYLMTQHNLSRQQPGAWRGGGRGKPLPLMQEKWIFLIVLFWSDPDFKTRGSGPWFSRGIVYTTGSGSNFCKRLDQDPVNHKPDPTLG